MDLAALRTQQQQLAASVERADRLDRDPPALIGGADVGFEQEGEITRAAMVLLTWPELELVGIRWRGSPPLCPIFPAFSRFAKRLRCWRRGSSFRKNRTCSSLTDTAFLIPGDWASPAILA